VGGSGGSGAEPLREHDKVAVRVLHHELTQAIFAIAGAIPSFADFLVKLPPNRRQGSDQRRNVIEVNLKHRALPQRTIHRAGLVTSVALTKHQLRAIAFEEDELLFRPFEGDFETTQISPKSEALCQVVHMEFRDEACESSGG